MNLPTFYLGLVCDQNHGDNLVKSRVDTLALDCELGNLKVPGIVAEPELPATPTPPLPALEAVGPKY